METAFGADDELGEGATWDAENQRFLSIDIMRGRIHVFDPASEDLRTLEVGQPIGAIAPRRGGGVIAAARDGFAHVDPDTGALTFIAHVEHDRHDQRMNDGACDAAGRFWAGTMALDEGPGRGTLYRLDPDGSVRPMLPNVTVSNGIDWSLDGRTMYYVDSREQRIDRFDFDVDAGTIANRRPFVKVESADGSPDGLTVDSEGGIWLALWGGSAIRRYLPDGTLDREIPLPVTHPTTCAFGGPDLADLYITTARITLSEAECRQQPLAGSVLRCRPGSIGRPSHAFAG